MYPERPLSELGVTPNVIYRFPYEGVSMQDPFTFILSFGNVD